MPSSPHAARSLLIAAAMALLPALAVAQNYKADEIDRKLSSRGAIARNYVKGRGGDPTEFKAYVETYMFPSMTQPTAAGLEDLEKTHENLFKNFLYAANGPTQKYLHEEAMKFAVRILKERGYHPAVRNNALLILGKLDDRYATDGGKPAPSAKANDLLCGIAGRALSQARPQYELVGALIGLDRHARFFSELPGTQRTNTARTLYKVLASDDLPGGYTSEVKDWIYIRAATAVAKLGTPGPRGVFAMAIGKRLSDDSRTLETRAEMASQLAGMKAKPGDFDTKPLIKAIIDLSKAVAKQEAETAVQFEDYQLAGGQRFVASDRSNLNRRIRRGTDRDQAVVLVREGIVELLRDLRSGVRAVRDATAEADQAGLPTIDEALTDTIRSASNKDAIDLAVTDKIKQMASAIEGAAAPEPAAAEE